MRTAQRVTLVIGALLIAAMVLVPPWERFGNGVSRPIGYAPIFDSPSTYTRDPTPDDEYSELRDKVEVRVTGGVRIDAVRLAAQVIGTVLVIGAIALALRPPAAPRQ